MTGRETNLTKNHTTDRVLVLKPMEGKDPKNSKGMVDNRLFTGDNKLHAVMDPEYGHWYLKFDMGTIPPQLQQRWTNFTKLYEFTKGYYLTRDIEIVDVIG